MTQKPHTSVVICPECENRLISVFAYINGSITKIKGFCYCYNCNTILKAELRGLK